MSLNQKEVFMKYKVLSIGIISGCILFFMNATAYANSSWHWLTTSPMTILPFAIVFTLFIETITIARFNNISNTNKVFVIVSLANLLSFLAPYLIRAYRFIPTSGGYSISAAFNKGPYYIVLSGYLLLTLIVELPVVYSYLRKEVAKTNKRNLIQTIIVSNVITTLSVAICERLICIGQW